MQHWIVPANLKYYDALSAFRTGESFWPVRNKVAVGDVFFLYLAAPYKQIAFECDITELGLAFADIIEHTSRFMTRPASADREHQEYMRLKVKQEIPLEKNSPLSYGWLKENGLRFSLMAPRKLDKYPELLGYVLQISRA